MTTSTKSTNGIAKSTGEPDRRLATSDTDWTAPFLQELRKDGIVGRALVVAKVGRGKLRSLLKADPNFAEAYADAKADAHDRLLEKAYVRALAGDNAMLKYMIELGQQELYSGARDGGEDSVVAGRAAVVNNLVISNPALAARLHQLLGPAQQHTGGASDASVEGEVASGSSPIITLPSPGGSRSGTVPPVDHRDAPTAREKRAN